MKMVNKVEMNRLKIFISAYACEPGLGSEIGVGWHWVLEMSKYFELWVLTRQSNRHTIEPWIGEHPEYSDIHFLYYDWPKWAQFWKKGMRGVRTYYNIWQACTNGIVKRTMQKNDIRIFHHLTYGNVMWKVSSYGQRQFFVWGPVGGMETIPMEYADHYDRKSKMIERMRHMAVSLMKRNAGFKRRCRNADLILCKTDITRMQIPKAHREKAILFTDVAVDEKQPATRKESVNSSEITEFVTVGRLDAWRGFDLVIEAMALFVKENQRIHLTIIGKGADEQRLKTLIARYGLEPYVTMAGKVDMDTYFEYMKKCDAVINASLKEGAVTVSFDSMALGKPLLCIDTTGYTRYFSEEYAIIVQRGERKITIQELGKGILTLTDKEKRADMGERARLAGKQFTWQSRGEEIRDAIMKAWNKQ